MGTSLFMLLQVPPVPDFVWFQNVVLPIMGMGLGAFAMFGVYRTVNRALDRRHESQLAERSGSGDRELLDELRGRVDALEDQALRVQELEERLEFTERLITQQQHRRLEGE